jgi:hypothetical protein
VQLSPSASARLYLISTSFEPSVLWLTVTLLTTGGELAKQKTGDIAIRSAKAGIIDLAVISIPPDLVRFSFFILSYPPRLRRVNFRE